MDAAQLPMTRRGEPKMWKPLVVFGSVVARVSAAALSRVRRARRRYRLRRVYKTKKPAQLALVLALYFGTHRPAHERVFHKNAVAVGERILLLLQPSETEGNHGARYLRQLAQECVKSQRFPDNPRFGSAEYFARAQAISQVCAAMVS